MTMENQKNNKRAVSLKSEDEKSRSSKTGDNLKNGIETAEKRGEDR